MVKIRRAILSNMLEKVEGIASGKTTMPILNHIALNHLGENLVLEATNLEVYRRIILDKSEQSSFKVCLPANVFTPLMKASDGEFASFSCLEGNSQCVIKVGQSEFTLPYLPYEELPNHFLAETESGACFSIKAEILYNLINNVMYAASIDDSRYTINCVHLHYDPNGDILKAVGLDGQRLAMQYQDSVKLTSFQIPQFSVNISLRVVPLLLSFLAEEKEHMITVTFFERACRIERKQDLFQFQLLNVAFPDYNRLLPDVFSEGWMKVRVDKQQLDAILNRGKILYDRAFCHVSFYVDREFLVFDLVHKALGELHDKIPAVKTIAQNITFAVNPIYFLDILKRIEQKNVAIFFKNQVTPLIILGEQEEQVCHSNVGLLMQSRIVDA